MTRGNDPQKKNPIKYINLHKRLDKIHREAFNMGFNELRKSYEEYESIGTLRKAAKLAKEQGNVVKGKMLSTKATEIEKSYLTRMRQDFKDNQK